MKDNEAEYGTETTLWVILIIIIAIGVGVLAGKLGYGGGTHCGSQDASCELQENIGDSSAQEDVEAYTNEQKVIEFHTSRGENYNPQN